jgi:hypothetical protein
VATASLSAEVPPECSSFVFFVSFVFQALSAFPDKVRRKKSPCASAGASTTSDRGHPWSASLAASPAALRCGDVPGLIGKAWLVALTRDALQGQ